MLDVVKWYITQGVIRIIDVTARHYLSPDQQEEMDILLVLSPHASYMEVITGTVYLYMRNAIVLADRPQTTRLYHMFFAYCLVGQIVFRLDFRLTLTTNLHTAKHFFHPTQNNDYCLLYRLWSVNVHLRSGWNSSCFCGIGFYPCVFSLLTSVFDFCIFHNRDSWHLNPIHLKHQLAECYNIIWGTTTVIYHVAGMQSYLLSDWL